MTLGITARVLALGDHDNRAEVFAATTNDPDSTPGNGIGNSEDDEAQQSTSPIGTDADVDITDTGFPGDTLALSVDDADMNANPAAPDTLQVSVTQAASSETETLALTDGAGAVATRTRSPTT